jgi:hypothetical protein
VSGEGRAADGEVSRRRSFHPLNSLGLEMLLNTRSGSGSGLQSPGVHHLVRGAPYVREIRNERRLIMPPLAQIDPGGQEQNISNPTTAWACDPSGALSTSVLMPHPNR